MAVKLKGMASKSAKKSPIFLSGAFAAESSANPKANIRAQASIRNGVSASGSASAEADASRRWSG